MTVGRLRRYLSAQSAPVTYARAAADLGLTPPGSMRQLTDLLEALMVEDAGAGRPLLAARVVSRTDSLPGPGFFDLARRLGLFDGADPRAFHAAQLRALASPGEPPRTAP